MKADEDCRRESEPGESFVETGDGRLHVLDWGGSGPQVHLLHANGFCAGTYGPFVRHLRCACRVFASDIRGHGASDPSGPFRVRHWRLFADDLCRTVEAVMTPPVVGMGHSLGAVATLIAAAERPELFSALVLIEPVVLPRRFLWPLALLRRLGLSGLVPLARGARRRRRVFAGRAEALRRFAAGRGLFRSWSTDFIEAYLSCGLLEKDGNTAVLRCDPETEARIFESVPADVWQTAARVHRPVLALRGERSDTFRAAEARRLASAMADCRCVTLAGCGHFLPMERPEACAREVLGFLGTGQPVQETDS